MRFFREEQGNSTTETGMIVGFLGVMLFCIFNIGDGIVVRYENLNILISSIF